MIVQFVNRCQCVHHFFFGGRGRGNVASHSVGARDLLTTGLSPNAAPDYHHIVANGNFFLGTLGDQHAQYRFECAEHCHQRWDVQLFGNDDQHRDEFEEVACEFLLRRNKVQKHTFRVVVSCCAVARQPSRLTFHASRKRRWRSWDGPILAPRS